MTLGKSPHLYASVNLLYWHNKTEPYWASRLWNISFLELNPLCDVKKTHQWLMQSIVQTERMYLVFKKTNFKL